MRPHRLASWPERIQILAERNPRRIGQLARRIIASHIILTPPMHFALGWALLRWERLPEASEQLRMALAQADPQDTQLILQCTRALLLVRQTSGEGLALLPDWEALATRCQATMQWEELCWAYYAQISLLSMKGQPLKALNLADSVTAFVEAHGSPAALARHRHVMGIAANGCAEFERAQALFDWEYAEFQRLGYPVDQIRALFERAWLWQRREQFDHAEHDLQRALQLSKRYDLPLRIAFCQKDLGLVARAQGHYGHAMALTIQARELLLTLGQTARAAHCRYNLATIVHMSGLYDLAITAYHQAQLAFEAEGNLHTSLMCQRNQAMILNRQDRPAESLALLESLLPALAELGDQLELAEALAACGQALARIGEEMSAQEAFLQAQEHFHTLGNLPAAAECALELGWLALGAARFQEAARYITDAQANLADRPNHFWRVRYGLGIIAEHQGATQQALDHYSDAVDIVASLRRQLNSQQAGSALFTQARELHQRALQLAVAHDQRELLIRLSEQQRSFALQRQLAHDQAQGSAATQWRREATAVLRLALNRAAKPAELAEHLQSYQTSLLYARHSEQLGEIPIAKTNLSTLRAQFTASWGNDWTILLPIVLEHDLILLGITPEAIELERRPYDAALQKTLSQASQPGQRLMIYRDLGHLRNPQLPAWQSLNLLSDYVLPAWLSPRLHAEHRLFILPSGPLYALPWAALRHQGAWLCEQAIIQLLPQLNARSGESQALSAAALLIGCESFGDRANPLPVALESLELVASHWPGLIERMAGSEARRDLLLEKSQSGELQSYGLIHIASHAQLSQARGLLAHIKLADEDLLFDEALQLQLRNALVVLAACEGGSSEVLPGDEVLGLSHALLAAGASQVIASLWPIYDRGVLALLEPFYRELAAGNDPARALALAQRALIASQSTSDEAAILRTPFIWGGFSVTSA